MLDFTFEFQTEIPDPNDELRQQAENRLRKLTKGHSDLTGALVSVEEVTEGATPHGYDATVVVYKRPSNLAATEKSDSPDGALKGALSAVERQVRESRDKLRNRSRQP